MNRLTRPIGDEDHVLGPADAPVSLVEYGDYECPHCARAHRVVAEVLRRAGDDVVYCFRHFPLSQVHPHALMAAQAAEAAAAQGRFWPMHGTLFENRDALSFDDLLVYAQGLGLDLSRFSDDVRLGVQLPKVAGDFRSGVRSGVNGTPTFFIDGMRFDQPWDADSLTDAVHGAAGREHRAVR